MSSPVDRRTFTKTMAVALAGAAVPAVNAQQTRRLKVGHTGITWGFSPADAEAAIKDVASLGYHGYESFGNVLDAWESKRAGSTRCWNRPSCRSGRLTAR